MNSINKNKIKKYFLLVRILSQLANKHKNINNVVNNTKNNEIPSIPITKFIFQKGIHENTFTNWKIPIDLLKNTHKKRDKTNVAQAKFKETNFNKRVSSKGINNNTSTPNKGKTNTKVNKSERNNIILNFTLYRI